MAGLKLTQFSGELPRVIPRLLPEAASQRSENVRLESGGLSPIRKMRLVHNVEEIPVGAIRTIYKHGEEWLAWSTDVNAAQGPVAHNRLYYTGDGKPKMRVDGEVFDLAVPYPTQKLTITLSGTPTSDDVVTRLYAYTFVTEFGEESEPCPLSEDVDWQPGMNVTLSGFQDPPAGRRITKQRIYRSQSGTSTGTDLYFIAERNASTAGFLDTVGVEDFGEPIPSFLWNAPPDDLAGLISLPNGMMAGFVGKDLYFCEPWRPHAWPQGYVLTFDFNIVALGAFGTSVVVATDGQPYIVSGTSPEVMVQEKLELNLPCINARGVVDLGYSVAYPSHDGLVVVSSSGASVATTALLARNDWQATGPDSFVAGQFSGRYFASFEYLEADDTPIEGTFIFDLKGELPFMLRGSVKADACHYDIPTGSLYMLIGKGIYEWDALGQMREIMTWKSKKFVLPAPASYGCILIEGRLMPTLEEIEADEAARQEIIARNELAFAEPSIFGEMNGAPMGLFPMNGDVLERIVPDTFTSVEVLADGKRVAIVNKVNEVVRLPGGFRSKIWEVSVNGTMEIDQISMATTPMEINTF